MNEAGMALNFEEALRRVRLIVPMLVDVQTAVLSHAVLLRRATTPSQWGWRWLEHPESQRGTNGSTMRRVPDNDPSPERSEEVVPMRRYKVSVR